MRKKPHRLRPALLLLLCLGFLLSGCGGIEPEDALWQKAAFRTASVRPVRPELTPEPLFQPGETIYVDGTELSGSFLLDGVLYVRLRELCSALALDVEEEGDEFCFVWRGLPVEGVKGEAQLAVDSELFPLEGAILLHEREPLIPVCSFCRILHIGVFQDEEGESWYFTPGAGDWALPEGYRVPILMYHGVSDEPWGNTALFVRPSEMEEQLLFLLDEGYDPIWFEDLEHVDQYDKPVILTFDDGYADNYTELFPLLQEYGVKATVFVVTDWNWGLYMTDDMLREMAQSGLVSIQSHTKDHKRLTAMWAEQQAEEMLQSKLAITRITGKEPFVLCYPEGSANTLSAKTMDAYYRFGLMMVGRRYYTGDDPHWIYRIFVGRNTDLTSFKILLNQ